jgi:hypothetical protein
MSLTTDALATGLTALKLASGEAVVFRGNSVTVIVNHDVDPASVPAEVSELNPRSLTSIEVDKADLGTSPKLNEVFSDADGVYHHVMHVINTPNSFRCLCARHRSA